MEFKSNVNADCCTPTGKYELCGCVNGVPYIQLTVVGGGVVQTAWLNTETGDTFTSKPAGFLTGTCSEAATSDVLKFSATDPMASEPFAAPKDGDTTIVTSDGTATGDVLGVFFYEADAGVWVPVTMPVFKEQNRFYADPNGVDTNSGANEAPFLTAQAAVTALGQGDTAVINEGTYDAVTMSLQNTTLVGASGAYASLTQIAAITVSTASGTSNRISDLTVTGNVARTGNAPLYLNNTTVSGNVTLAGTAYTEIRDSSIQDGSITVSGASTLFVEDSKLGTSTFSTVGSVIAMRNVTIDAGDCVTIGAGVIYSLQDVTGCVTIDPAAINAEQAMITAGLSATQAEAAATANFMHIRMHNADVELNPTQIVTRDPVTGELEVSNIGDIIPEGCCVPAGGTDGQVLTAQPDGTFAWETPAAGGTTEVADGTTITGAGTSTDPFEVANPVPSGGTAGQVLAVDSNGALVWVTPETSEAPPVHVTEVVTATAAQTEVTLTDTPIGAVIVTRNGIDISDAWTWVGNVGTYNPAANLDCVLDADDKLRFHFETAA